MISSNGSAEHNGSAAPGDSADLAGEPFSGRSYPGSNRSLASIRADVGRWFGGHGFSPDTIDRAVLLVSELCSNAVEAGPGHPVEVTLTSVVAGRVATITVSNTTLGATPPPSGQWLPADPLAPRGRGLAIVDALADQVQVDSSVPGRVTVVARISN